MFYDNLPRDHVSNREGNSQLQFTCPVCEWEGIIAYSRKPPTYCTNACKQKAKRQRKAENGERQRRADMFYTVVDERFSTRNLDVSQLRQVAEWLKEMSDSQAHTGARFDLDKQTAIAHCATGHLLLDIANWLDDIVDEKIKNT